MAAGAKADDLRGIVHLRLARVVFALETPQVDEHRRRRRLAGQRRDRGSLFHVVDHRRLHHDTGHGFTCQMSDAYSAIVRSLENLPEPATFRIALRAHAPESAYTSQRRGQDSRTEGRTVRDGDPLPVVSR